MIFTLFAMSLVPTVGLLQILRIEAYYTLPWVSKHTAQKQNSHSVRHRRERVCQNRLLVIVSGVAMDTTSSPAPENKSAPQNKSARQKKSRRAFGASATLARRIGAARVVPYEAEKGEHVISFPFVPRALAEWAHEECAGHPCSNSDVEDMQDTP